LKNREAVAHHSPGSPRSGAPQDLYGRLLDPWRGFHIRPSGLSNPFRVPVSIVLSPGVARLRRWPRLCCLTPLGSSVQTSFHKPSWNHDSPNSLCSTVV